MSANASVECLVMAEVQLEMQIGLRHSCARVCLSETAGEGEVNTYISDIHHEWIPRQCRLLGGDGIRLRAADNAVERAIGRVC